MKHSERFALNQWLSDYPDNLSYAEIVEMMIGDEEEWTHEYISVWQVAEHFTLRQVVDFMEDTRKAIENTLDNLVFGVALANKTEEESIAEGAM
jgi:hypothetical protein